VQHTSAESKLKLTYRVNIDPSLSGSSAHLFSSGWNVLNIHGNCDVIVHVYGRGQVGSLWLWKLAAINY